MLFRVDPSKDVPLSAQIAACVRRAVADGSMRPGDRLPPARELAGSLGVSIHTVLAGYQQVRDEGLIDLRRSRGATIRQDVNPDQAALTTLVRQLVETANRMNLTDDELAAMILAARTHDH